MTTRRSFIISGTSLAAGQALGLIRVAVGLEHIDDIKADLAGGLDSLK